MSDSILITQITTNTNGISVFSELEFAMQARGGMFLTDPIGAKNFRIRKSVVGYETDFHLSGDATFILIQKGSLKIELQNGESKIFNAGNSFIANDNLPDNNLFDSKIHGHKASVVGNEDLLAIHIKL
jgi:hypothetical protein